MPLYFIASLVSMSKYLPKCVLYGTPVIVGMWLCIITVLVVVHNLVISLNFCLGYCCWCNGVGHTVDIVGKGSLESHI